MNLIDTIEFGFGGDSTRASLPAGSRYNNKDQTPWNREAQRKGGPDKGGIVAKKKKKRRKTKALKSAAGSPSEGSSRTARSYRVVDGMDRVLHKFRTKEEAEEASAGNRYTRVKSQIPPDATPEVRDMIRKRPGDNQVRTFKKALPYLNNSGRR